MIPVFLCTVPYDGPLAPLRDAMFLLVRNRWKMEPKIQLTVLTPAALGCDNREFQRERRIEADKRAVRLGEPFYVVADDDCLPASAKPFLEEAVRIMQLHPGYSILGLMPTNARIYPWKPQEYLAHENLQTMEHVNVGCIRVCRAGMLTAWPPMSPESAGYDAIQAEAIREKGRRVGYFKDIFMNHLGEGYSSVW